jgi:hypothetical protein
MAKNSGMMKGCQWDNQCVVAFGAWPDTVAKLYRTALLAGIVLGKTEGLNQDNLGRCVL